jgi:ABC-type sugar transport system permease subunit
MVLLLILGIFPAGFTLVLSFFRYSGSGPWAFLGFGNYVHLIHNPEFVSSLWNCLYLVGSTAIPLTVGGLVLAVLLDNPKVRGRKIIRTLYVLPFVTSSAIIAIVFSSLFDQSFGWINAGLRGIGLPAVPWLVSGNWTKVSVSILIIWQFLGYNMVLMLGGLQSIPSVIHDAARVDGCTGVSHFTRIVVPLMRPTILFCFVLSTIGVVNLFTQVYILTGGGPLYSSETPSVFLYNYAFQYGEFGVAAAAGIIIFVITAVVAWMQFRVFKRGAQAEEG